MMKNKCLFCSGISEQICNKCITKEVEHALEMQIDEIKQNGFWKEGNITYRIEKLEYQDVEVVDDKMVRKAVAGEKKCSDGLPGHGVEMIGTSNECLTCLYDAARIR